MINSVILNPEFYLTLEVNALKWVTLKLCIWMLPFLQSQKKYDYIFFVGHHQHGTTTRHDFPSQIRRICAQSTTPPYYTFENKMKNWDFFTMHIFLADFFTMAQTHNLTQKSQICLGFKLRTCEYKRNIQTKRLHIGFSFSQFKILKSQENNFALR